MELKPNPEMQHAEFMEPFRPYYAPLQWRVSTRRHYIRGVTALVAVMAIAWLISAEPWPTALTTVLLLQLAVLAVDAFRYQRWRSKRSQIPL